MKQITEEKKAIGIVPMKNFIPKVYLEAARVYKELFESCTLSGKVTDTNRDSDQLKADLDAIALLQELQEAKNIPLAYGFMWYNETGITKLYWVKRVGKLRKNKADFFSASIYLEWLNEIYTVLTGHHPSFSDPLYYYKLDTVKKDGTRVGFYDVMNSFRVQWNRFLLSKVAQFLNAQDKLESSDPSILSIDEFNDDHSETGANNRFEASIEKCSGNENHSERTLAFLTIEAFLKNIANDKNMSKKILEKSDLDLTYRDVMKIIVNPSTKNPTQLRMDNGINYSVYNRVVNVLKNKMKIFEVSLEDLASYIELYWTVATAILDGKKASYLNV